HQIAQCDYTSTKTHRRTHNQSQTPCVVFFQAEDGIRDSSVTGVHVCSSDLIFSFLGWPSRGWFPSIDLWVMGPARFRCATLLSLTAVLLLAPGLSLQKYIVEK